MPIDHERDEERPDPKRHGGSLEPDVVADTPSPAGHTATARRSAEDQVQAETDAAAAEALVQHPYRNGPAHRSIGGDRLTSGPTDTERATHKPPPRRKRRGGTGPTGGPADD